MRVLINIFCRAQVSLTSRLLYSVVNLERWHQGFKRDSTHSSENREAFQNKSFLLLNWYVERNRIQVKKRPKLKTMFLVLEIKEDYQGYKTKDLCLAIQFTIKQVILFSLSEVHWDWQQRNNVFWTVRYAYHILVSHLYMSDTWFCSGPSWRNIYIYILKILPFRKTLSYMVNQQIA